jgi:predicted small lipoprotein YifL
MRSTIITARLVISLLVAGTVLTACGQRGALYLPEESRNVVVTPAPAVAPALPADAATPAEPTEEQRRNSTAPAK